MRTRYRSAVLAAGVFAAGASCGGRAEIWDQPVSTSTMVQGLAGAVAVVDDPAHRVLLLRAAVDQSLNAVAVPVGHRVVTTGASPDGGKLFVLSMGDQPRTKPSDETPSLTVVDVADPGAPTRYELPDVYTSLAIDPNGSRVVIYVGDSTGGNFIQNRNELLFVDVTKADAPTRRTLPSLLGGYPKRLTFAPGMRVGATSSKAVAANELVRELLFVESDRDLMVVDLDHPDRSPITMPISDRFTDTQVHGPAAIVFDTGAAGRDPVVAVRSDTDNVYLYRLAPVDSPTPGQNDFDPIVNTIAVDGTPTDFAFVRSNPPPLVGGSPIDDGARLAVVVAKMAEVMLINETDSTIARWPALGSYQRMSVGAEAGALYDQVLLYKSLDARETSVAWWNLGKSPVAGQQTISPPERIPLDASVQAVLDVPGTTLKVFQTSATAMYVFDLAQHMPSPLITSTTVETRVAREGRRAWAFVGGQPLLDQLDLAGPHVVPVLIDRTISDLFEIERGGANKALVVLHGTQAAVGTTSPFGWRSSAWQGGAGVTVFDAVAPDPMTGRRYSGVLLEGLIP